MDLGDRKAGAPEVADLGEERVVAASRLGTALDDVTGHGRTSEGVEVGPSPPKVRRSRTDDERGVGDAAGDHDVGAGIETGDDPPSAEIGVGRERRAEAELVGPGQEVVALDVGDVRRHPQRRGELPKPVGQSGRV